MKNLHITCGWLYSRCDEAFVNCKNLESFTLNTWSEFSFDGLYFNRGDLYFNRGCLKKFSQFLITQRDSLETMKLGHWMNIQVFETILSMPRLKKLFLGVQLLHPLTDGADFSRSQSIIDLELSHFQNRNGMNYKVLLQAFPNVEILKISEMYNELADAISATCKSLKRLHVETFAASAISNIDFFLELEEFSCADFVEYSRPLYKSIFWCKKTNFLKFSIKKNQT